jgi:hypothetical protein
MADLVTVADARAHLRLDSTADDAWLAIFIPAISDAVARWLKDWWRPYVTELDANNDPVLDSSGDQVPVVDTSGHYEVKPSVRAAVLVELGSQFRFREGDGVATVPADAGYGYTLCNAATALLSPLRKSTLR